jgi:DNA-binding NarL/FixJ family response regulator
MEVTREGGVKHTSMITKGGRKNLTDLRSFVIRDETGNSLGTVLVLREVFNFEPGMNRPQKFVLDDDKTGGKNIKLMVASPYAWIKDAIEGILENQTGIEVVAHALSHSEVVPVLGRKKPDVLFLDTDIANLNIMEMLKLIREKSARTKILLFFHNLDEELVLNGLHLGVRGYMAYESSIKLIPKVAVALSRDELWMDANVMSKILNRLLPLGKFKQSLNNKLTKKEKEIVQFVLEGLSNKQISDKLFVSENTVKNHLAKIFSKLQVNNRLELVLRLNSWC